MGAQKLGAGAYVKKPYTMEKIGIAIKKELAKLKCLRRSIEINTIFCQANFIQRINKELQN
jgi:hypothetical protein